MCGQRISLCGYVMEIFSSNIQVIYITSQYAVSSCFQRHSKISNFWQSTDLPAAPSMPVGANEVLHVASNPIIVGLVNLVAEGACGPGPHGGHVLWQSSGLGSAMFS